MSKQKIKKPVEKKADTIKLTNRMIYGFQRNPSIAKLKMAPGLRAEVKFKLFKLIKIISDSAEAKALREIFRDMAKKHEQGQEKQRKEMEALQTKDNKTEVEKQRLNKLSQEVGPLQIGDLEMQKLFDIESGLSIEKLIIPIGQLPSDFTANDMLVTDWIIDFE